MLAEVREEVHLEGPSELGRSAEGEVHVLAENLGDVRTGHFHALGELRLRDAQFLHPA